MVLKCTDTDKTPVSIGRLIQKVGAFLAKLTLLCIEHFAKAPITCSPCSLWKMSGRSVMKWHSKSVRSAWKSALLASGAVTLEQRVFGPAAREFDTLEGTTEIIGFRADRDYTDQQVRTLGTHNPDHMHAHMFEQGFLHSQGLPECTTREETTQRFTLPFFQC